MPVDHRCAVALAVAAGGAATIGGALISEHVFGYLPCMLCLWQRWPYYVGVPLALLVAAVAWRGGSERLVTAGLALLALVFAVGSGLGVYHAGVEYGWWLGPASCGGGTAVATQAGSLLDQIRSTRVVPCDAPALTIAGLSLAGWNALIAALLALAAASAALRGGARGVPARQGSSSLSQ